MQGKGLIIGIGIVLGVIAIIVIAIILLKPKAPASYPPSPSPSSGPELPTCDSVAKLCRSKCINKWWIPFVGITEFQKCMDKCKLGNPCM